MRAGSHVENVNPPPMTLTGPAVPFRPIAIPLAPLPRPATI